MSRSRRKEPYCPHPLGYPGDSEKVAKRNWHQKMRTHCRVQIQQAFRQLELDVMLPSENQVGNVREMNKEGKYRFDPSEHPKKMRK